MSVQPDIDGMVFTELEAEWAIEDLRAVKPVSPTGLWTNRDPWLARLYGPTEWRGDCLVRTIGLHKKGYTYIRAEGKTWRAHALAWEIHRGPIPEGLTIDHLCKTTSCILIDHMEVVTREENSSRRQGWHEGVCARGHDITDPANVAKSGRDGRGRRCRPCWNQYQREFRAGGRRAVA